MAKQLAFVFALGIAAFGAGWWVNGLYHDSLQLNIERAAKQAGDKARAEAQAISVNRRVSLKPIGEYRQCNAQEIRTEVIKPVFTNVCVSPEFVSLYNRAAERIERELSGKSVNQMPNLVAETERANGQARQ
ncbi:hypothetical protein J4727_17330 [Providencia rettgeri]|uniref:Uncharacterized protein n=1 Tax=Providencia rettgeri TaxID=587 RepID=A0A939SJL4_PRORE|nr:hypothetical protein [Providencia rettgeri]